MKVPQRYVICSLPVLLHCHNVICNSLDVRGIDVKMYVKASDSLISHLHF